MSVVRCDICWQPVSRHKGEMNEAGRLCHVACLHPTAEMAMLDSLLGPVAALSRQQQGPVVMAAEAGHEVVWTVKHGGADKKPWRCTCGLTGIGAAEKRSHLLAAAAGI